MSNALLDKVSAHIAAQGYETGLTVKYHRYSDKDLDGKTNFICYRRAGDGGSNVLLQATDVNIVLVTSPNSVQTGDDLMTNILKLFRNSTVQAGIVRFDPVGNVRGPRRLENGRPLWELTVRCYTENE